VVQLKCFAKPIDQATQANAAIVEFFGDAPQPATVWVQWLGGAPTEIELIAWAPSANADAPAKPNLQSHTPPHLTKSPVYSRMIEIDNRRVIYISGLYAPQIESPADEVRSLFDRLQQVLTATASDMRHLAKATYYVRGDIGSQYGEHRPKIYDAKRPPAASMVALENVGRDDRHTVMDMIAVPVD
jgi:enamine deaminase RidA (YjgF/YER057c/UK114 family)